MDEKLSYLDMLDMPASSCTITNKKVKKKKPKAKKVDSEQVKAELVDKVNSSNLPSEAEESQVENFNSVSDVVENDFNPTKGRKKFSILTAQLLIIGVLIATIFVTNSVYPNSGLKVFMRNVFGSQTAEQVDNRLHTDFAPVISIGEGSVVLSEGVMTISNAGSIYSACDGKVSSLTKSSDDKFVMEITHNQNFISVLSGLDFAYCQVGDMVYSNIPVGFVEDNVSMCFKDADGVLIDEYVLENNSIIWSV